MTLSAEMKSRLKRIWNVSTSIIVALAILLAVLLVGFRLFGFQIYTVLSGSMEPEIMTGSLVYVKGVSVEEAQNLKVGDNVTFQVDKNGTKETANTSAKFMAESGIISYEYRVVNEADIKVCFGTVDVKKESPIIRFKGNLLVDGDKLMLTARHMSKADREKLKEEKKECDL